MLKPITATILILNVLWLWNDFLLPLIMLTDVNNYTLMLSINMLFGQYNTDWPKILAALVLTALPVIVFMLFSRSISWQGYPKVLLNNKCYFKNISDNRKAVKPLLKGLHCFLFEMGTGPKGTGLKGDVKRGQVHLDLSPFNLSPNFLLYFKLVNRIMYYLY